MKFGVLLLGLAASVAVAEPQVSDVTIVRDAAKRTFTVSYWLSEPGIVTAAFYRGEGDAATKIHESHYAELAGDVGRYVEVPDGGGTCSFVWQTEYGLPDTVFADKVSVELTAWAKEAPPDYVAIDLSLATNSQPYAWIRYYTSTNGLPGGIGDLRWRQKQLLMRKIPAKDVTWQMGSVDTEVGRGGTEVRHKVMLTDDYYMAVFPTTYGQSKYMFPGTSYANNRVDNSGTGDPTLAQGSVAFYYLLTPEKYGKANYLVADNWLIIGKMQQTMGIKFYLPTEAQWEYACRSGCGHAFYNGHDLVDKYWDKMNPAQVRAIGWIYNDSANNDDGKPYGPRPVGLKIPNAWGLYDMVGNVSEFCYDAYGDYAVDESGEAVVNPVGSETYTASKRVMRGGYYNQAAQACRSAGRFYEGSVGVYKGYGFRLVCPVDLYGSFTSVTD